MLSLIVTIHLKNPSTTSDLHNSDPVVFDLEYINRVEMVAFLILGFTVSLAAAQQKYWPLQPMFEKGIMIASLIPLPFTIILEGLRQSALMANEITNGTQQSPN